MTFRISSCIRILTVVGLVVVGLGIQSPIVMAATPGFTWQSNTLVGTAADDLLVLGFNGTYWTHNRFAEGDHGFVSNEDFDPAIEGAQRRAAESAVRVDLGAGNDRLEFAGSVPDGNLLSQADAQAGNDVLDFADVTGSGVTIGGSSDDLENSISGFELIIGTPLSDYVYLTELGAQNPGIAVQAGAGDDEIHGTSGDDVIDAGSGSNLVASGDGNDTITVALPFGDSVRNAHGGNGTDRLNVVGTANADVVDIVSDHTRHSPEIVDAENESRQRAQSVEVIDLDLGAADDSFYVEAVVPAIAAHGGPGSGDELVFNAMRFSATQTADSISPRGLGGLTHDGFDAVDVFNEWFVATGTRGGGAPHVRSFDDAGTPEANFYAYAADFGGGVNVATGDLDGDGVDEIVTAPGPGGGPHVRAFLRDGTRTDVSFFAYGENFRGGVKVATGDLDGDGIDEIITVPATDGGPHVRAFRTDGTLFTQFFALGFGSTGLNVSSIGSQYDGGLIVVGSGAGSASRLGVFKPSSDQAVPPIAPFGEFRGGVSVAGMEHATNFTDHRDGIAVAAGPGGGPHVRTFRLDELNKPLIALTSFYAFDRLFTGGVSVSSGQEQYRFAGNLMVAAGPGATPHVRGLSSNGAAREPSLYAYGPDFRGGVTLAASGARPMPEPAG